jgi:hypothetical protein
VQFEQVADGLWIADGGNVNFYGLPYPTRSVIVRLSDGGLWVWSPIKLTPELRRRVDALGVVQHLVSPNKLHHLFLHDWKCAFSDALLWGPQSTVRKRRDLHFDGVLDDKAPAAWGPDIDQAWFRGSFAMDEIVFCHLPTRTAIVADLIQTFSQSFLRENWGIWRFLAPLDGLTKSRACAPLEWRLSFLNREPARRARAKVLAWACQRVIVAHGEWVRTGGGAQLEKSFRWLGPY